MFKIGDYVRRKPEWQNQLSWKDYVKPEDKSLILLVTETRRDKRFKFLVPKGFSHFVGQEDVFDQYYFEKVVVTKNLKDYA